MASKEVQAGRLATWHDCTDKQGDGRSSGIFLLRHSDKTEAGITAEEGWFKARHCTGGETKKRTGRFCISGGRVDFVL